MAKRFEEQEALRKRLKELQGEMDAVRAQIRALELPRLTRETVKKGRIVWLASSRFADRYGVPKGAKGKIVKMGRKYVLASFDCKPGWKFRCWPDMLTYEKP